MSHLLLLLGGAALQNHRISTRQPTEGRTVNQPMVKRQSTESRTGNQPTVESRCAIYI